MNLGTADSRSDQRFDSMSLKDSIFGPLFGCHSCDELKRTVSQLKKQLQDLSKENGTLKAQFSALESASAQPLVPVSAMSPELGWAHLKASVSGFKKPFLQDAHQVLIAGEHAVLIVCDGAGSKKHSKAGADFISGFLADKLRELVAGDASISAENWSALSRSIFSEAALALKARAASENKLFDDYGCTCIVVYAGKDFVACSHVGDGRAGYLAPSGHWKALLTPYKGALANATVFMTMLDSQNTDTLIASHVVEGRTRAIVALSDGPEDVCWQVSAFDSTGKKVVDPNQPSNEFLGKIANQLVAATAQKAPQDSLDKLWADFLTTGSPKLAAQVDDKTLLLALRG